MIQGTTPTHLFKLPFHADEISALRIVYEQKGKVVLSKEDGYELEDSEAKLTLSQEETLMFDANVPVRIQLHALNIEDKAFASKPISVPVHILLDRRVI